MTLPQQESEREADVKPFRSFHPAVVALGTVIAIAVCPMTIAARADRDVRTATATPGQTATPGAQGQADLRPGAELKGLTRLGLVVEDLDPQAAACGLTRDALDTAAAKSLTAAGLQVVRNSDEDTYLYVNAITTTIPTGLCVTRYDATLYTHTTAKLPYTSGPVLVQVELLHKGGIAGGTPAANGQAVSRGLTQFIDQFVARIADVNKK